MPDGLDWLLAPVLSHLCSYESLKNGSLDLADIALMNEALIIASENRTRAQEYQRWKNGGR